jgi:hypothetical protein
VNHERGASAALLGALLVGVAACSSTASAPTGDHRALAEFYVEHIDAHRPTDNSYGGSYGSADDPPYLYLGPGEHTRSRSRCNSFLTMLLKGAYPALDGGAPGADVLGRLTGSASPDPAAWHDAIEARAKVDAAPGADASDAYGFERIDDVALLRPGDLLASTYRASAKGGGEGETGHVMVVDAIGPRGPDGGGPALEGATRYVTRVFDSSSARHSDDTRAANGNTGLGRGTIVLFRRDDPAAGGRLAGWAWSESAGTTVYSPAERHLVAGRLYGPAPGLPARPPR